MEITGKIIQILPKQTGTSKAGNPWEVQPFVLETQEQYPRKVYIEVFGSERIKECPLDIDHIVTASIDIDSLEYQGRWYTKVRAWKIVAGGEQPSEPASTGNVSYPDQVEEEQPQPQDGNGDLPF